MNKLVSRENYLEWFKPKSDVLNSSTEAPISYDVVQTEFIFKITLTYW